MLITAIIKEQILLDNLYGEKRMHWSVKNINKQKIVRSININWIKNDSFKLAIKIDEAAWYLVKWASFLNKINRWER